MVPKRIPHKINRGIAPKAVGPTAVVANGPDKTPANGRVLLITN